MSNYLMDKVQLGGNYFEDCEKLMKMVDKLSAELMEVRDEMHYISLCRLQESEASNIADRMLARSLEVLKEIDLVDS